MDKINYDTLSLSERLKQKRDSFKTDIERKAFDDLCNLTREYLKENPDRLNNSESQNIFLDGVIVGIALTKKQITDNAR